MNPSSSRLKRPRYPTPAFVEDALLQRGLMESYRSRPPYQQNDYIGWITRAKRKETQERRLAQMLDELERGDAYMKMPYRAKRLSPSKEDEGG
ncbi:MAG: YdeI/OmpD-associated family protein [Promethearchaeota archaeon]